MGHPPTGGYEEKELTASPTSTGVLCFNGLDSVGQIFAQFIAPRPGYSIPTSVWPYPKEQHKMSRCKSGGICPVSGTNFR